MNTNVLITAIAVAVLLTIIAVSGKYFRIFDIEPETAAEISDKELDEILDEYAPEAVEIGDYAPPMYGPETFEIADMTLRLTQPHLFRSDWLDQSLRDLSAWSVDMRMRYALAS